ncbi:MAG: hypothetical protein RLP09_10050, partial [Sandaracinaceae bacterium]
PASATPAAELEPDIAAPDTQSTSAQTDERADEQAEPPAPSTRPSVRRATRRGARPAPSRAGDEGREMWEWP